MAGSGYLVIAFENDNPGMGVTWSQIFPPPPTLTEVNLPSQNGKVFIVTGGYSGVGFEICRILYRAGGTVYLAGRSEQKALDAISKIKSLCTPTSPRGNIMFLPLSLDDLTTIKPAVKRFTTAESRLDVLFNNAGVSNPPRATSPQGHDLQLATNCLGPHLFTQLLLPVLRRTASATPVASVRVIWTASIVVDAFVLEAGIELAELFQEDADKSRNYLNTKMGNWFLADALASQTDDHKMDVQHCHMEHLRQTAGNIAITTASATRSYTHLQNGTFALAGHFLEAHAFMLVSLVFALASALDFLIYVT
ncbi:hypothetical protein PENNAL_c0002G00899 [Penicillium nalgiovense]|uniref:Ketoreductase (KR) domain-containing protein n=1 Tax=Penicillium nalgiovense TaxID=60175 RepID=A0A1V6Z6P1_PENNA|nr:hypothetical protein PENNAL_c0002G00899 [Penicillium nalgiovense]